MSNYILIKQAPYSLKNNHLSCQNVREAKHGHILNLMAVTPSFISIMGNTTKNHSINRMDRIHEVTQQEQTLRTAQAMTIYLLPRRNHLPAHSPQLHLPDTHEHSFPFPHTSPPPFTMSSQDITLSLKINRESLYFEDQIKGTSNAKVSLKNLHLC